MADHSRRFGDKPGNSPLTRSVPPKPRGFVSADSMEKGAGDAREFSFTAEDFDKIRGLIHKHAGIALSSAKQDMVYSRLARRLRATGDNSFAEYLARLERGDAKEWETFVNSLTTNLTSFFREPHHFPILADLLKKVRGNRQQLTLWCSASSTGEEAYSIAMTAVEALGSFNIPVTIVASDLDTQVLATAEKGVYPIERVEKLSAERLQKFFLKGVGARDSEVSVRPELRRMVTFRRINLLDGNWPLRAPLDAIFCRNVMIYFDKPTQYRILQKFEPLLAPGGLLFAGHSESFLHASDLFKSLGRTVYARTRDRA